MWCGRGRIEFAGPHDLRDLAAVERFVFEQAIGDHLEFVPIVVDDVFGDAKLFVDDPLDFGVDFLRRALAEPPPPGERSALLLDLGMAEANAGLADWAEDLQLAVDTAPNAAAAAEAAMVLGLALSRGHRFAEAVEVLDRAASSLDSGQSELALLLEAAAVIPGMNDPATAPSVALRRPIDR